MTVASTGATTDIDRMVIYRRTDDRALLPLASPTTDLGANSTSIATSIAIGFTFAFDAAAYTSCALSARGFLRLDGSITSSSNSNLFAAIADVVLAPWWDALETAVTVGYVKHETQGTAPFRRFVAEWYCNLDSSYDGTDYARAKFQVVLYESWNAIEYRYGTRETGGSPANTGSASIGFKGDTTGTADNYRDCATPSGVEVDNLALGGSKTTTTASLRHYVATEWPSWTLVAEPNWPMLEFYFDTDDQALTGLQHPYADPFRIYASNSNWLYCRHTPAAINASPWCPANLTLNNPIYVIPFTPSADGLVYQVWVETYQANTSPGLSVGEDNAPDPQPATDADWATLSTQTGAAATGDRDWTVFEITPSTDATALRFKFTSNDLRMTNVIVAPKQLSDFDPTATYASGWQPVAIGQVRQRAAPIHPEFLNRCWRNAARVALDRVQMLWSFVGAQTSDFALDDADYEIRTLAICPAAMSPAWVGQSVDVTVYGYDSTDGAALTMTERGGSSVAFVVDSNGSEYRMQTDTLQLVSAEPVLALTLDPSTTTYIGAAVARWVPPLVDEDYILPLTPAPRLEYLAALAQRQRLLALAGYAYAGLATYLRRSTASPIRLAWLIGPAVKAMRPKVARHAGTTKGAPQDTSIYGRTSSGTGAADEIILSNPNAEDRDSFPPDGGPVAVIMGSPRYDATPAAAGDRALESPTAGIYTGAAREVVSGLYGVGMCLVPIPDDPSAI